jgi:general secretion pathway protein I
MINVRDDRGFTLLEVLVAFVIAALALAVLYQGALDGLLATRVAGRTEDAVTRAQSHLAAVGHGTVVVAGDQQGNDGGGYHWRLLIRPGGIAPLAHGDDAAITKGPHVELFAVTVWISWQEDGTTRDVRLDSERVGLAPPETP